MCAVALQEAITPSGRPSRSAPITNVTSARSTSESGPPLRATRATLWPGSSPMLPTRTTGTENSAPMDARTALCPNGSAVPGPRATLPAPNASAERSTVPTLPGSPTPHSATHTGPTGTGAGAAAAGIRSSPSATNVRSLSRQRRPASLRSSLSDSLLGLVMGTGYKKGARPAGGGAPGRSGVDSRLGRQRLAGGLGESAEGVGVAHGDVGQDLAVDLDPGQLQAVHERAVGHPVLARG